MFNTKNIADKMDYNNKYILGLREDMLSSVAQNKVFEQYTMNGLNLAISDSSTFYSISSSGLAITAFDYTATNLTLSITSSSSADALGSSGINTLLVFGVNQNYDPISETINLNGTSAVHSVANFQFVNRVIPIVKGSNFFAAGNINCSAINNTNKHFTIGAGYDSPYINRFVVPRGYTAIIDSLVFSNLSGDSSICSAFIKSVNTPLFTGLSSLLYQGTLSYNDKSFTSLPEFTYFVIGAKRTTNNATGLSVNLRYFLIKNTNVPSGLL